MPLNFKLYSTLTNTKEDFVPIEAGKVGLYVCGVTPYDFSHIGHGRGVVVYDTFARFLRETGWQVKYVRNFTDVDDKIIARANERGMEATALAQEFIEAFTEDAQKLNEVTPDVEPRVSTHMQEIIDMIQLLLDNGVAYVGDSGDVLLDTTKVDDYGKLSKKPLNDLIEGARVEVSDDKKTPTDSVLWKLAKPSEPKWASPWGEGRPGWHIECSAMSAKHLGKTFDIHGGGMDLIFPHHENEVAQSEGAHKCKSVNYWMHLAFINFDGEKMSKSLGNFKTIRDMLQLVSGEAIRLYMLGTHYRKQLNFTVDALQASETALEKLYRTLKRAVDLPQTDAQDLEHFYGYLADDLNTPKAQAEMFNTATDLNAALDQNNLEKAAVLKAKLVKMGASLGLLTYEPVKYLKGGYKAAPEGAMSDADVEQLVQERTTAKTEKNWARADEIRDLLKAENILLEDGAEGTSWVRK